MMTTMRNYLISRVIIIMATMVGMQIISKVILHPSMLQNQMLTIICIFVLPATIFIAARRFDKNIIYPELDIKMQSWPIWVWLIVVAAYVWSITLHVWWYLYYLYPIVGVCVYSIIDIYSYTDNLAKETQCK